MAEPGKNIVYCCLRRPGYRGETYPTYSTRVAKWISLQPSTQRLAKRLKTWGVCYFLLVFFFSLLIEMGKGKGHGQLWAWWCFCPFEPVLLRAGWAILKSLMVRNLPIQRLSGFILSNINCPNVTSYQSPSGYPLLVKVQLVSLGH